MSEKLGRYNILEQIGKGGFATVYRARDTTLERDVALKTLHPGLLNSDEGVARFIREAKTIARLHHPNIVPIYDVLNIDGRLLIVMPLVKGSSLDRIIAEQGKQAWSQAWEIFNALGAALTYAHGQGILHRDLKPANIMLDPEHGAQLSDFGLAKLAGEAGSSVTAAGGIVGTPQYIAPEVWEARGTTPQSDIYALGCILFEMVTGQVLFGGDSAPVVMMAHFSPPPLPQSWPDGVPPGLTDVLQTALAQQPDDRYATATEMVDALASLAEDGPPPVTRRNKAARPAPSRTAPDSGQLPSFLQSEALEPPVFVSREAELTRLRDYLEKAIAGQGQLVFVTGEAGQGKTSLVTEFARQALGGHQNLVMAQGACVVYTGVGDPFLPFREIANMLTADVETRLAAGALTREQALRLWQLLPRSVATLLEHGPELLNTFVSGESLELRAANYGAGEAAWLAQLREQLARKANRPHHPDQGRLFEAYTNVLKMLAAEQPLLLILDDLHWADLSSVGLLAHLGQHLGGSRMMLVGTYRPEDIAQSRSDGEAHPLAGVLTEFKRSLGDIWLDLAAEDSAQKRAFVDAWLDSEPNRLSEGFRQELTRHTGGHPLFVVELLRDFQDRRDLIRDETGQWIEGVDLDWQAVPTRVEGVIEKRISRLGQELREALTVASVEGEEFTAEVIAKVQQADERGLVRRISGELDKQHRLVDGVGTARLGRQRLSRYRFHHNLFQKYLYNTLDEMERAYLHEDVGTVLETLYGEQSGRIAVQLARHFQEAGIADKSVGYLIRAAEQAMSLSANGEAADLFNQALSLLPDLPEGIERDRQELAIQSGLGIIWNMKSLAAPETGVAYTRALELARHLGETASTIRILAALTLRARFRSELEQMQQYAEECLHLAEDSRKPELMRMADMAMYVTALGLGRHGQAVTYSERIMAAYRVQRPTLTAEDVDDQLIDSICAAGFSLIATGYPDRAVQQVQEGLDLALEFDHHSSITVGRDLLALMHLYRGDWQRALALGQENQAFAAGRIDLLLAQVFSDLRVGVASIMLGQVDSGLALLKQAIATTRAQGVNFGISPMLAMAADGCGRAGRVTTGLALINEALTEIETHQDFVDEAWIHRVKGDLLLLQDLPAEQQAAEACLQHAIDVAQSQQAKLWETRALASLCRLRHRQGRGGDYLQRLADLFDSFTEGFETEDLRTVKAVLVEVSS